MRRSTPPTSPSMCRAELTEAEEESLARLETLREKVARIGEVNVGAIDELKELEERAQFLRTQKDDLERSLADIEKTIQRLNRASRTKFAETFARGQREVSDGAAAPVPRRRGPSGAHRRAQPARDRRRDRRAPAGQAAGEHHPAVRRREGAGGGQPDLLAVPHQPDAVLLPRRGRRAARRRQHRPLHQW